MHRTDTNSSLENALPDGNSDGLRWDACEWWDGVDASGEAVCSSMALFRLTRASVDAAAQRAALCARVTGESCILSHEVGLEVPGVFLYGGGEAGSGMRLLITPARAPSPESANASKGTLDPAKRVRVSLHGQEWESREYVMEPRLAIEYYDFNGRAMRIETLEANDAFCVQLLARSVQEDCATLV